MARKRFDIDSLPSNNQEEPEPLEIVTTGNVKTRKGGGLAKNIRNISNSLFSSIVMPAVKGLVLDFFNDGLRMAMFGRDNVARPGGGHTNYHQMQERRHRQTRRVSHNQPARRTVPYVEDVFDDIFFDNRADAELVLGRMMERIAEYGWVTVGDLYSLTGLSPNYTSEGWVWYRLDQCRIEYTGDGFVIDFPEPEYRR